MATVTDTLLTAFKVLGLEEYKRAFDQAAEKNKKLAAEEKKRAKAAGGEGGDAEVTGLPAKLALIAGKATAAAGAFLILRQALAPLVGIVTEVNQAFIEQEQAFFRMHLVLRNLGRQGEISGLTELNLGLAATTGNTAAALAELTALLVQFGLTEAEIKKTTPVLLDWSRATGIEATRAADILGSALRNEKDAIQRYGVDIDLTKSKAEKLASALEQLEARFKGGAEAAAGTLGGALDRLHAQTTEFKSAFGRFFEPISRFFVFAGTQISAFYTGLFQLFNLIGERLGILSPLGGAASGIGSGAVPRGAQPATEASAAATAANTKKTAEGMTNLGKFLVGGGAAAAGSLNIRGLNAALRAGR